MPSAVIGSSMGSHSGPGFCWWYGEENEFDLGHGNFEIDLRYWIDRSINKSRFQGYV